MMPVLIARFRSAGGLADAVVRLRAENLGPVEIHSPHPVVVEDDFSRRPMVSVPVIALIAGMTGFLISLVLQIYADLADYLLDIGGRPPNSWPAFIPTAFENGILCAVLAGFASFPILAMRSGGHLSRPLGALRDGYFLTVRPRGEEARKKARRLLREAETVEEGPP